MPLDRPISVVFFALDSGWEPVREWLKGLDRDSKKAIGEDIKTVQFGWPLGMPLVRKMDDDIRTSLKKGIARTFFTMFDENLVLLHGFLKRSQKTPAKELSLAKRRLSKLRSKK